MLRKFVNSGFIGSLERSMAKSSLVGDTQVFAADQFPWAQTLETHWRTIRQELDAVLQFIPDLPRFHDISTRQSNISLDDSWKTYFFFAHGLKAQANCDRCPETTRLLEQIPGLQVAFFSILAPHRHIPRHRGLYKGVIRYHLGLIVPEPRQDCWIRIDDEQYCWEEGKSLIFDDTYYHEVWNKTDGYRVVLFLDIERPLRFPWSAINRGLSRAIAASPIVQSAKANHAEWEQRFAASQSAKDTPSKS